jgi:hypothetical protein
LDINFHPHAVERMAERGAEPDEVRATVESGERFSAKFGRQGFRKNFPFDGTFRGKGYHTKQVEVVAVQEGDGFLVLTVITRYF